jgi:prepilin-type N-terminal cleavage/methylation domain-containing protein
MMYYNEDMKFTRNGFTVVELLIVIAIIGVLASVVLPRLETARYEGLETKKKTELVAVGKRAAIEESSSLTFDVVCGTGGSVQATSISDMIFAIESFSGDTVSCNSQAGAYAVSIPLDGIVHWCVDSGGIRIERSTALAVSEFACE